MKNLCIILLALIILPSCKKKQEFHYLSEEFKKNCLFTVGSYWIYKNDSTGLIDSTFISIPPEIDYYIPNEVSVWETATISCSSSIIRKFFMMAGFFKLFIYDANINCTPWVGYWMYAQKGLEFTVDCYFNEYFDPQWRIHIKEIYPEYIVNQHFYKNIQFIRTVPTYQAILSGNDSLDVYYSKGKGIIRLIHYNVNGSGDTESWSLLRYRVVQ